MEAQEVPTMSGSTDSLTTSALHYCFHQLHSNRGNYDILNQDVNGHWIVVWRHVTGFLHSALVQRPPGN